MSNKPVIYIPTTSAEVDVDPPCYCVTFGRNGALSAAAILNVNSQAITGSAAVGLYIPVASTLKRMNISNSVSNLGASGMDIVVKYATPPLQHAFPYDALSGTVTSANMGAGANTYGNGYGFQPEANIPAGKILYVDLTNVYSGSVSDLCVNLVIRENS